VKEEKWRGGSRILVLIKFELIGLIGIMKKKRGGIQVKLSYLIQYLTRGVRFQYLKDFVGKFLISKNYWGINF